ncbi:nucleotidyltransferase [Flavobacteriaceae bacterium Ap0902]|nr:nucleotidyltransferase [Flavobacteriaceae bacterium Ap0902]
MARTIEEIQEELLQVKANESELNGLDSTSRTAIWRLWLYIVSFCAWTLERLFDIHRDELYTGLYELKPHTARWYRNKALAFLYGFDLMQDSDQFDLNNEPIEVIESAQIVKYAAVVESEDQSRLIIKIAGENAEKELSPIKPNEKEAFDFYMSEVRDAGVRLTIINYLPDLLKLDLTIKRDPLVLNENGVNILTGKEPVKDAIKAFMKELPFNGELSIQRLEEKILAVPGVLDLVSNNAQTAWIDAVANTYGQWEGVYMSQIPVSGYFAVNLDNENEAETLSQITYV